jgi:hypothetical protein
MTPARPAFARKDAVEPVGSAAVDPRKQVQPAVGSGPNFRADRPVSSGAGNCRATLTGAAPLKRLVGSRPALVAAHSEPSRPSARSKTAVPKRAGRFNRRARRRLAGPGGKGRSRPQSKGPPRSRSRTESQLGQRNAEADRPEPRRARLGQTRWAIARGPTGAGPGDD